MKVKISVLASCLLFLASTAAFSSKPERAIYDDVVIPAGIAECVSKIPPAVTWVHRKAIEYARMSPNDLTRWKKRLKYAALLPRLQFGYERRIADAVAVEVDDSVSVTSSGTNVGPTASGWNQNLDRNHNIEVKAVWYLDELIFNREDLSVSSEARSQIGARREMLGDITDDYFELKRLVSIYKMQGGEMSRGRIRLEIGRLIGRLDSVTDGAFNHSFKWEEVSCE